MYVKLTTWLRLKNMLQKCHGHGLTKGAIIQIFYHGLDESTQAILDITAEGIFLYKSPNQAFQFLEDKSLKEDMHEMRNKYQDLRDNHDPKNHLNDDKLMCERHEANYIKSEGYQNQDSHNLFSRQSYHDLNDSKKSLTELNNDVRNDHEDFKRCIRSMRNVHWKLFARDDGKTTGVLPNKKSKPINQEPQSKTDFEKLMTKFLDDQRVTSMFFKNNVNDMILKIKQNEKNFQIKIKKMERKMDEWSKSQNISLEQTDRTEPQPPPQAHTEQVNVVFTESGKSDDPSKTQKDSPPSIIFVRTLLWVMCHFDEDEDAQLRVSGEWACHWSRPITSGRCLDMIPALKAELHSLSLSIDRDALRWGLTLDGSFTVGTWYGYQENAT
ncbi:hypothetical protein Tco_1540881 [Tanacetum coccineum]